MKTLYIECNMGAAGDMLMAALYELLEDKPAFLDTMNRLGLPGVRLEARRASTCGLAGTHMAVTVHGQEEVEPAAPEAAGQAQARGEKGAMFAIVGLEPQEIAAACEAHPGFVQPVNYNAPSQTVIAGAEDAVEQVAQLLTEKGGRAVRLAVSAAFHSPAMEPAAKRLREELAGVVCQPLRLPFYSNRSGARMEAVPSLADYLALQMTSPVRFTDELSAMRQDGVEAFLELGPGKVLSGLVKKTLPGVSISNIENCRSLDKAAATLAAK